MSTSLKAYAECEEYFNQALASERGIAIELETQGMATRLRQKLNTFRKRMRERNASIFPPEDPRHGVSDWEHLVVATAPDDPTVVTIKPQRIDVKKVSPL